MEGDNPNAKCKTKTSSDVLSFIQKYSSKFGPSGIIIAHAKLNHIGPAVITGIFAL
jgi:hypothetical protein